MRRNHRWEKQHISTRRCRSTWRGAELKLSTNKRQRRTFQSVLSNHTFQQREVQGSGRPEINVTNGFKDGGCSKKLDRLLLKQLLNSKVLSNVWGSKIVLPITLLILRLKFSTCWKSCKLLKKMGKEKSFSNVKLKGG